LKLSIDDSKVDYQLVFLSRVLISETKCHEQTANENEQLNENRCC